MLLFKSCLKLSTKTAINTTTATTNNNIHNSNLFSIIHQIKKIHSSSITMSAENNLSAGNENPPVKVKTEKELRKEKEKAEKMAKFLAKQAKKEQLAKNAAKNKEKKKKQEKEPIPEFVDKTVPGEKKLMVSLDDPSFSSYNPKSVESSWYDWWVKEGFFEPEFTESGDIKPEGVFSIPAPPPNVTGALHIGHALTVSIQDALIRYYRMKGKTTLFLPGFDHAGIATQSVVEKTVYAKEGKTRHDYGREEFLKKIWEWKEIYHDKIKNQFQNMGASYDWSKEAFTMDPVRSAAVNDAFVKLFDDGTIYRDLRLVNWCVKLNTALSNLEVENKTVPGHTLLSIPGYDEKVEFGVLTHFAYPVVDSPTNEKLIVATTRPETIFGDTGVAVHPTDDRYKHLHGKFVKHPFLDKKIPIITDSEAVDMEFGTGAVKITPGHDNNDYNTGKRNNLDFINIFTDDGLLNEECGEFQGLKRFDARKSVINKLKELDLLIDQEGHEMTLPICSRSGDIIEPYLKPQWWISQKEMAKSASKAVENGDLKITPETSEKEFHRWMENIQDWCISRQLWWGHRCPVYFVKIEGEERDENDSKNWIAGRNFEEAKIKAEKLYAGKNYELIQDEDVLDTWFSSGLWPFSTLGYPEETFDFKKFYPMSMLETGWDILFFWVARMVMLGIKLTGQVPFKEVFCHSLVRDAQGRKMSKSLGNVIDPSDVINGISLEDLHKLLLKGNLDPREIEKAKLGQKESYPDGIPQCGTDALRFALCAYTTGGRDINLDILRVAGYRKFCNKIFQATKFVLMRLGDDYKPPNSLKLSGNESLVEKWILHKLTKTTEKVTKSIENRDFYETTQAIYNFWLYDLCDVYIENSKFLILEGTEEQKKSARDTLYTCIDGALRLIHPFMPFITEEMWQRLPKRSTEKSKTIVKASYPIYIEEFDDEESLKAYNLILEITKGARSLLSQYGITKNGSVFIESSNDEFYKIANSQKDSIVSLIKAVEKVEVISKVSEIPNGCVLSSVAPDVNVHLLVKGMIDIDNEINKFNKKLDKSKNALTNLDKIMTSSDYESKASEQAKEKNQQSKEKTIAEIEGFEQTIANLEKLKL